MWCFERDCRKQARKRVVNRLFGWVVCGEKTKKKSWKNLMRKEILEKIHIRRKSNRRPDRPKGRTMNTEEQRERKSLWPRITQVLLSFSYISSSSSAVVDGLLRQRRTTTLERWQEFDRVWKQWTKIVCECDLRKKINYNRRRQLNTLEMKWIKRNKLFKSLENSMSKIITIAIWNGRENPTKKMYSVPREQERSTAQRMKIPQRH